jgi:hypothetical protein
MTSHRPSFRNWGLLALIGVFMGACVTTEINPPQLYMEPLPPRVTNLKLENGSGDVFYDGKHPGSGKVITANPTPQQLDGTVTITRTYDNGEVKKQTLTYPAGKPLNIGYRGSTDSYYINEQTAVTMPRFYGGLRPTYEFLNRPDTAIVRQDQGGQLAGFVKADNESNNPAFNGRVGFNMDKPFFGLGRRWGLELSGNYYSSTAKDDRDVVPAGTGSLAVFGPVGGGGVNFGNNDITNLRYNSDYTSWESDVMFFKDYDVDLWDEVVDFHSYFGIEFGKNEDDQSLMGDVPGLGVNFNSGNWIDDWFYGPVGGFESAWEVYPRVKVTTGAFGKLLFNDLSAKRMITLSNGLTGNDKLSNSEWTLGGGASIGLKYEVKPGITAQLGYTFEYANNTPVINVDRTTGDASVDAEGADKHEFYVGIKIDY